MMYLQTFFLLLLSVNHPNEALAFVPTSNNNARPCCRLSSTSEDNAFEMTSSIAVDNNRKQFLQSMFTAVATSAILQPTAEANAAVSPAPSFLGTYSDPINHPGGKRTITLIDGASNGDYQLAQVKGGGGRGEPAEYILPAVIFGDRAIVIDFSPKGGPRDFTGVLEKDGSIRFIRDNNRWPRL